MSMISRPIVKKLVEVLSEYCYVTEEQLGLSLLSGSGHLDDLVLKPEALEQFDLPCNIVSAKCHSVKFDIPWTRLRSRPVEVEIAEVVVLATNMAKGATEEQVQAKLQRAKKRMVDKFEADRKEAQSKNEQQGAFAGFASRLVEMIVHNIMVNIKQIHVRFEASTHDATCGLIVNDLKLTTTDENGNEKFVDPAHITQLHKRLSFRGLRMYAEEPDKMTFISDLDKGWNEKMSEGLNAPPEETLILGPIDGIADAAVVFKKFIMEKQDTPFMKLGVKISDVIARLSRQQYVGLLRVASLVMTDLNNAPSPENQQGQPELKKEYAELFRRSLFKELKEGSSEQARFDQCEKRMNAAELIEVRKEVYGSMKEELAARREKQKASEAENQKKKSWFSWGGSSEANDNEKIYSGLEKEFNVEDDDEKAPDTSKLPEDYRWQDVTVSIGSLGAHLRDPEFWPNDLTAAVTNLGLSFVKRQKEGCVEFGVAVVDMAVSNPTRSAFWIQNIVGRAIDPHTGEAVPGNLLDVWGCMKPVKQPIKGAHVDGSIHVSAKGVVTLFDMGLINNCIGFFAMPDYIQFPGLAEATAAAAKNARDQAGTQLYQAFDSGTAMDIQVNAAAPTIILPMSLDDCRPTDPSVVVSLGKFEFRTLPLTDEDKERRIKAAKDGGIGAGDDDLILYLPNEAAVERIAISLLRTDVALRTNGAPAGDDAHFILPPFGARAKLYQRLVKNRDDLPPIVVHAAMDQIGVSMSVHDSFVVRQMMDFWTKKAAEAVRSKVDEVEDDDTTDEHGREKGAGEQAAEGGKDDKTILKEKLAEARKAASERQEATKKSMEQVQKKVEHQRALMKPESGLSPSQEKAEAELKEHDKKKEEGGAAPPRAQTIRLQASLGKFFLTIMDDDKEDIENLLSIGTNSRMSDDDFSRSRSKSPVPAREKGREDDKEAGKKAQQQPQQKKDEQQQQQKPQQKPQRGAAASPGASVDSDNFEECKSYEDGSDDGRSGEAMWRGGSRPFIVAGQKRIERFTLELTDTHVYLRSANDGSMDVKTSVGGIGIFDVLKQDTIMHHTPCQLAIVGPPKDAGPMTINVALARGIRIVVGTPLMEVLEYVIDVKNMLTAPDPDTEADTRTLKQIQNDAAKKMQKVAEKYLSEKREETVAMKLHVVLAGGVITLCNRDDKVNGGHEDFDFLRANIGRLGVDVYMFQEGSMYINLDISTVSAVLCDETAAFPELIRPYSGDDEAQDAALQSDSQVVGRDDDKDGSRRDEATREDVAPLDGKRDGADQKSKAAAADQDRKTQRKNEGGVAMNDDRDDAGSASRSASEGDFDDLPQADANAKPMIHVEFRTRPYGTAVVRKERETQKGEGGKKRGVEVLEELANPTTIDFAKDIVVLLNPAAVVYDSMTIMTLVDYATVGFLARLSAVGGRARYDGKTVPRQPDAPTQLAKLDITVLAPRAIIPQDPRKADAPCLFATISSVTIKNEIRNRDSYGSQGMMIDVRRVSVTHQNKNSISLRMEEPLTIDMDNPIIPSQARAKTIMQCKSLGDVLVSESGLVDLFAMMSYNLLRFPDKDNKPPAHPRGENQDYDAHKSEQQHPEEDKEKDHAEEKGHDEPDKPELPMPLIAVNISHFGVKGYTDDCHFDDAERRDEGLVFAFSLDNLGVKMIGTTRDVQWDAMTFVDGGQNAMIEMSEGAVHMDNDKGPKHTDITLRFDLRRVAVTDQWLHVFDFAMNERAQEALGPMVSKDNPDKAPDAKSRDADASTKKEPKDDGAAKEAERPKSQQPPSDGSTMTLAVTIPSVVVPFLKPGSGRTEEAFCAKTQDITVVYSTRAIGGFDLDVGVKAFRFRDSEHDVPIVSEGRHADEQHSRIISAKMSNTPHEKLQTADIKIDRLLASVATPTVYSLIDYLTNPNGTVAALSKMSQTREARERSKDAQKFEADPSDPKKQQDTKKEKEGDEGQTEFSRRVNEQGREAVNDAVADQLFKIKLEWIQPTICIPASVASTRELHAKAGEIESYEHDRGGAIDLGIIIDLGSMVAEAVIDTTNNKQKATATLKDTKISGLMTEFAVSVNFEGLGDENRQIVDARMTQMTFSASPHAMEVLNNVLNGNLLLPDETKKVQQRAEEVNDGDVEGTGLPGRGWKEHDTEGDITSKDAALRARATGDYDDPTKRSRQDRPLGQKEIVEATMLSQSGSPRMRTPATPSRGARHFDPLGRLDEEEASRSDDKDKLENQGDTDAKKKYKPEKQGGLELSFKGDAIVLRCTTDEHYLFSSWRIVGIDVKQSPKGMQATVERIDGRAEAGTDRTDAEEEAGRRDPSATSTDLLKRSFLKIGDKDTNAVDVRIDKDEGTMDVRVAYLESAIIPEILGRTVDLALIFVAASTSTDTNTEKVGRDLTLPDTSALEEKRKRAVRTPPQDGAITRMSVQLGRVSTSFVAKDGSDVATLFIEGLALQRTVDEDGYATLRTRIADIKMVDKLNSHSRFPNILECRSRLSDGNGAGHDGAAPEREDHWDASLQSPRSPASSTSGEATFVSVRLTDIPFDAQPTVALDGVDKIECPRFVSDCEVAISAIAVYYVPSVLAEIVACATRAGAVMGNLEKTKKRAVDTAQSSAKKAPSTELMKLNVSMQQPTVVLIRDVRDPKTVSITPGALSVSNSLEMKGGRAYQVYQARIADMNITALDQAVLKQTAACGAAIHMDCTPQQTTLVPFKEPRMGAGAPGKGDGRSLAEAARTTSAHVERSAPSSKQQLAINPNASRLGDENYGMIADVELPPLKANITEEQLHFLLAFVGNMMHAQNDLRQEDDHGSIAQAEEAKKKLEEEAAKRREKESGGKPRKEATETEQAERHTKQVEQVKRSRPDPNFAHSKEGTRRHIKLSWTGTDMRVCDIFQFKVDDFLVNAVMGDAITVVSLAAGGLAMRHKSEPFLKMEKFTAGMNMEQGFTAPQPKTAKTAPTAPVGGEIASQHRQLQAASAAYPAGAITRAQVDAAATRQASHAQEPSDASSELLNTTEINADLGVVTVEVTPSAVKDAMDKIYGPIQRLILRTPEPGPVLKLETEQTVTLGEDLKPTASNYILASTSHDGLCTYLLDLNGYTLDLTATGAAATLIVLEDHARVRIRNGTLRLPGCLALRSFVSYGYDTQIEFNPADVRVERVRLNKANKAEKAKEVAASGISTVAASAKAAQAMRLHAVLQVRASICDDNRQDPVGVVFGTDLALQQRTDEHGDVSQRAITVGIKELVDVTGDLLAPTNIVVRVAGTHDINIALECPQLIATLRYQRAMFMVGTVKKIMAALPSQSGKPQGPSATLSLEDNAGRPLTRRSVLRQCSVCKEEKSAALGSGLLTPEKANAKGIDTRYITADEAELYVCVPCASGRQSFERTSLNVDIPILDATVVGKQGEMVQLSASKITAAMEQDDIHAELDFQVWTSNPYCGQWEALVEKCKVKALCVLSQSKFGIDVPQIEANVTGEMLRSVMQFQQDINEIMAAGGDMKPKQVTVTVANWTDATLRVHGKPIAPRASAKFTESRALITLDTRAYMGAVEGDAAKDQPSSPLDAPTKHYIALDRTAVLNCEPYVVDVAVKAGNTCTVDVIPIHSTDGIVKIVSRVQQRLLLLGCDERIESHGTLFLARTLSVDNAFVLQPIGGSDEEYAMAVPTNTSNPTIRQLLNGDEFTFVAHSLGTAGRKQARCYRVHAKNVGMSLGVPRFEITISGGFTFTNYLPHTVDVTYADKDGVAVLTSKVLSNNRDEVTIAPAAVGGVKVKFAVEERGIRYESSFMDFAEGEKRLPLRAANGPEGTRKELAVMVEASPNSLSVSAPFYVVNHVVIPLEMIIDGDDKNAATRNWHELPPADAAAVICCPPMKDTDKEPELLVRLRFRTAVSDPVPLHVMNQTGQISLHNENGDTLYFTYITTFTDDTYSSRTVVITPRWVVVNRTPFPLYFAQDLKTTTAFNMSLKPGRAMGYYSMQTPPDVPAKDKKGTESYGHRVLVGRRAPRDGAGRGLSAEELGAARIIVANPEQQDDIDVIRVTVKPEGAVTFITADEVKTPPYLFVNRTSEPVEIFDKATSTHAQKCPAFSSSRFHFCEQRDDDTWFVTLRVAGAELKVPLDKEKALAEGSASQSTLAMGLDYKLVYGPSGQVIVTLLPPAGTTAPVKLRRYSSLQRNDMQLEVRTRYMAVSVANNAVEIANLSVRGIHLAWVRKASKERLRFSIVGFQVDNNAEMRPPHPVVLFSLRPDADTKAIDFSMDRHVTGAQGYIHIPQFKLDIQPLVAKVGDTFLVHCLELQKAISQPLGGTDFEERRPHTWPPRDDRQLFEEAPKEEGAMATTIRIDELIINPIYLRLWFTRQRGHDVLKDKVGPAVSRLAISLEDVVVSAEGYVTSDVNGSMNLVLSQLQQFYTHQIMSQILGLAFQYMSSIPLVGAPIKYAGTIGKGVAKFFTEPIEGLTESPQAFAQGLARGTTGLVGGVVGGGFGAVSDVTKSGARLANVASGDKDDRHANSKTPGTVRGLFRGITGLVSKPMEGAQKGGATGLMKGIGQGVVGLVAAPVGGVLSDVSRVTGAAADVLQNKAIPDIKRTRPPRAFGHTGALVPLRSVADVYEFQRKSDHRWTSSMLPSDGPKTANADGKGASKEETERRCGQPADKWRLDRFRTNFDGWLYSADYNGAFEPSMPKHTHYRRRRWVLELEAVAPRNACRFAKDDAFVPQSEPDSPATARDAPRQAAGTSTATVRIFEVFENQRHFPGSGWGKHMLPTDRSGWSTESGSKAAPKDEQQLPVGWTWATEWQLATQDGDQDGWEYALDFPLAYSPADGTGKVVRRRVWRRVAVRTA